MHLVRLLIRTFALLLLVAFGMDLAFAAQGNWSEVNYPAVAQQRGAQTLNVAFAARAPPFDSESVASTGTAFAQRGELRALDDAITSKTVYAFLRSSIAPNTGTGAIRNDLIEGLPAGTRITPENVVDIRKLPDGRTVWLETGNDAAGLQHIYRRHEADFASKGIPREQVPTVVMDALQQGNVVGTNGSANVYRIVHNGTEQHIAIGVGSNGFVVRANPVSQWKPLP